MAQTVTVNPTDRRVWKNSVSGYLTAQANGLVVTLVAGTPTSVHDSIAGAFAGAGVDYTVG